MSEETKIDRRHPGTRTVLRAVGPVVGVVGLVLIVVGLVSFFSAFGTFQAPRYVWCFFLGLPLLVVGIALSLFAFFGAFVRYVLEEAAPVQKDTFNYLAEGTQPGVRTFAAAVGEGLAAGMRSASGGAAACLKCGHPNEAGARFCNRCGAALAG